MIPSPQLALVCIVCAYLAFCYSVWESPDAADLVQATGLKIALKREFAVPVHLLLGGGDELVAQRVLVIDPRYSSKGCIVAHRLHGM